MKILVLWRSGNLKCLRNADKDHAFSFERYDNENEYFYFNIFNGRYYNDYSWIKDGMFDAVIFHYTAINLRFTDRLWNAFTDLMGEIWSNKSCVKVLFTQDEYTNTQGIWRLANIIKADKIFTVIREEDHNIIFPKDKVGDISIENVLTGYVSNQHLNALEYIPHKQREYDVFYRAQKNTFVYGKHGNIKYEIARVFNDYLTNTKMKIDIKMTTGANNALLGDEWLKRLMDSRVAIGCLGGSGIVHYNLDLFKKIIEYTKEHPYASYEDTKAKLFPDIKENLHGVISPRIFECALTRTCQVLVGRDYQGILIPDEDYIMLKEDFSNIADVVEKMQDVEYCEKIAENCYNNVIASNKYTYSKFVKKISEDIKNMIRIPSTDEISSEYIREMCDNNNEIVMKEMQEFFLNRERAIK